MMDILNTFLSKIDYRVLNILVIVLLILIVTAILRKAVKFAITVGIIVLCLFMAKPALDEFRNNYNITFDDGKAIIVSEGKELILNDIDKINEIIIDYTYDNEAKIIVNYDNTIKELGIPDFMGGIIEKALESNNIKCTIKE